MLSKIVISSAVFIGFVNAAAIGRRQDLSSDPSASFPTPSSVVPSSVTTPIPGPSGIPAGCPPIVLPPNNGTDSLNDGTDSTDGTDPDVDDPIIFDNGDGSDFNSTSTLNSTSGDNLTTNDPTDVNSTDVNSTDVNSTKNNQGETWGQWGTNIGNYYSNLYPTPDSVPGLPLYQRSPAPETWAEWGKKVGDYWANRYGSPDNVPGLPKYKRAPSPFFGNYASKYKREIQSATAIALIRTMQIDVQTKMIDEGKGDSLMSVIGQLESLVAQADAPGADLTSILNQAQDIVNNA